MKNVDKEQKLNLRELDKLCSKVEKLCPAVQESLLRIAQHPAHSPTLERIEEFQEMLGEVTAALFVVHDKALRSGNSATRRMAAQIARRMQASVPRKESKPHRPRQKPAAAPTAALKGDASNIPIMSVLTLLAVQGKTGVMTANLGRETITMDLVSGSIVRLTCSPLRRGGRLGEILAESGAVDLMTIHEFMDTHGKAGGNLGDALVKHGIVTRKALEQALTTQLQRRLDRVLRASTCTFEFVECEVDHSPGFSIAVKELLVDDTTGTVKVDSTRRHKGLPGEFSKGWEQQEKAQPEAEDESPTAPATTTSWEHEDENRGWSGDQADWSADRR